MKVSITQRMFVAILAAACLAVISMFLIMHWSINHGFLRYVNGLEQTRLTRLAEGLEESYAESGNWDLLRSNPDRWRKLVEASLPEEDVPSPRREPGAHREHPYRKEGHPPLPPHMVRRFSTRVLLLDSEKELLFGPAAFTRDISLKPLYHQDRIVGYLGLLPRRQLSDERQLRFLKEQKLALALVAGMVVLVAGALSLPLANRLIRPLRALAAATHRLAAGQFDIRVPVTSSDEVGHLARDFNSLAMALEKNEQARRQWVADISHELRTPLAVLRGEIEGIQDGIRQATPDTISSLHSEVMRLNRLVEDLYQLSLSDVGALTYRKEMLNLSEILTQSVESFRPDFAQKKITVRLNIPANAAPPLFGDRERLRQLFANLLENTLKYTDGGGTVDISLDQSSTRATVDLLDSSPGVQEADLNRLFERLYRTESSRSRATGGAGLGLAICRNIVEAHEGSIAARRSPLGGLWIKIDLPLTGRKV